MSENDSSVASGGYGCDVCGAPADFTLTAAYPHPHHPASDAVHPNWATYPMPMFRSCWMHVAELALRDQGAAGSTPGYLLKLTSTKAAEMRTRRADEYGGEP